MSIEFKSTLASSSGPLDIGEILDRLSQLNEFRCVRRNESELGLVNSARNQSKPETITVSLTNETAYVAFHSATGQERDFILTTLQELLLASGIESTFEEL